MNSICKKLVDVLEKYANPQAFFYDKGQEARNVLSEVKNEKSIRDETPQSDQTGDQAHESYSVRVRE